MMRGVIANGVQHAFFGGIAPEKFCWLWQVCFRKARQALLYVVVGFVQFADKVGLRLHFFLASFTELMDWRFALLDKALVHTGYRFRNVRHLLAEATNLRHGTKAIFLFRQGLGAIERIGTRELEFVLDHLQPTRSGSSALGFFCEVAVGCGLQGFGNAQSDSPGY